MVMAHRRRLTLPLSVSLAALCLTGTFAVRAAQTGQDDTKAAAQRMIDQERDHPQVMANLEYLSDMIGPRLTGSARLKRANDWTAEKMKQYGLENVHLEAYTIPRGWERGSVMARIVEPNGVTISAAQAAWTGGTSGTISGPVVVFAPEKEEDFAAFKGRLKGAIVLTSALTGQPDEASALPIPDQTAPSDIKALKVADVKSAEGKAPLTPPGPGGRPANFNMEAFRKLRKAINTFMEQEGVAAVMRDAGKPQGLLNMTGSWESMSDIPGLFVAHEHIAMMQRLLKQNVPVKMELNVTSRFIDGPITVYNTVGEIKGSEKPNEFVLLGAHLDSWDLGTGSVDNGTGSMAVLEAARLIKTAGLTPRRTMRFVLFSGEEEGLFGSKAYVEAHKSEMPNMNVGFVHDTGTGRVKGAWLQERAECKPLLEQQFAMLKDLGLTADAPTLMPGKMNGTDHASFDDAGVPAFAFNQDSANYGLMHHSQSDTFDKVRADDLKQGACVLAIMGYNAAQMPDRYPRTPSAK